MRVQTLIFICFTSLQCYAFISPVTYNSAVPSLKNVSVIRNQTGYNRKEKVLSNERRHGLNFLQSLSTDTSNETSERILGILVLLTVPLSWGTYAPVVKYVYDMDPPVPGFVFSGAYYVLASVTLTTLSKIMAQKNSDRIVNLSIDEKDSNNDLFPMQTIAGIELGSYLFLGNCLQVVGLRSVPADRAAFLVQLTTIMVPLFQAGLSKDFSTISIQTWGACMLAFLGVIVMGLHPSDIDAQSTFQIGTHWTQAISFSGGDTLIMLAAVSYTMHVIRLGKYAKFTSPIELAASKATVEAFLSTLLVTVFILFGPTINIDFVKDLSSEMISYFDQVGNQISAGIFPPPESAKAIGAVFWTGWITCAYTIYAQSFGQRRVGPTDANLIYSVQPIFSAMFAWILLGEKLNNFGYLGAALIGSALWVVSRTEDTNTD